MTGVLKPDIQRAAQDCNTHKKHSILTRKLRTYNKAGNASSSTSLAGTSNRKANAGLPYNDSGISPHTLVAPSPIDRTTPVLYTGWDPPESWGVMRADSDVGHDHAVQKQPQAAPRPRASLKPSSTYYVRVFRTDGTFSTVSCPLDTTTTELLAILGRKFFLPSAAHYQIGFRRLGLLRILNPDEKPLMLQKRMLELSGYTDEDQIAGLGREDLGFLCRFLFIDAVTALPADHDSLTSGHKYTHVDLTRKNLLSLPEAIYRHAGEIVKLNLSSNLSLDLPDQFMQSCVNLQEIKFCGNEITHVPSSIVFATKLNYLDVSSNRLESLDDFQFDMLEALVSLKAQNNCLSQLPASLVHLHHLRYLNLSFNYLSKFPIEVCNLVTLLELDISFNSISELPPEIGQLCALETLAFTNNKLTGVLPNTFENLTSLKFLDIRYNDLTNVDVIMTLPRLEVFCSSHNSVSRLEKHARRMRVLHLNQNPVTRFQIPMTMATLTTLNLANAKMSSFPDGLFDMIPNLEKLDLDKNHFGAIPPEIGKLKRLTKFTCVGNSLASLPPEIGSLVELRELDVHSNSLSSLPSEIWQLANLEILNVSSNNLEAFPIFVYHNNSTTGSASETGTLKAIPSSEEVNEFGGSGNSGSRSSSSSRRPSNISESSARGPLEMTSSSSASLRKTGFPPSETGSRKDSTVSSSRLAYTFATSLKYLYLADNQLNDDCFKEISFLTELVVLNLGYNFLSEIPLGSIGRLTQLRELFLSGNNLTNLPADDLTQMKNLKIFHLNANKLLTIPSELAEIRDLQVLDVGSNSLKYNISNWPYDWNWNFNLQLKYLNLSGNKRLEIKPTPNTRSDHDLSDFSRLKRLRVLGLMDITLTNSSIPDQSEDRRIRTSGTEVHSMPYGMSDTLGKFTHLPYNDMVIERFRGKEEEVIFALFDGSPIDHHGSKIAKYVQERFAGELDNELASLREGEQVPAALRRTFLSLNKHLGTITMGDNEDQDRSAFTFSNAADDPTIGPKDMETGACATVVYITGNRLYIANVGDVRAILSRTDREFRVLTKKHEPAFSPEIDRIREAGGFVSQTGRLNGEVEVSRSFGYFNLVPCVQAAPSIVECELLDIDDMLIIASRNLWEYMDNQTAVDVAASERDDPMRAAQKLRDLAIAYGCTEKIVVMCVAVGDSGKSKQQLLQRQRAGMQGASLGSFSAVDDDDLFPQLKRRRARNYPEDAELARLGDEVSPPVGELAMVFTDIKNSTLLWETSPVAMGSAIKIHNAIMRRQLRIVGGYEVKNEGDAFMVCFSTAAAAMVWAFGVQSQLLVAPWPSEITDSVDGAEVVDEENTLIYRGLSVRMGIHWGSPVCERDPITRRMDYFGPMVNRAARISTVADGGRIAVSLDFVTEIKRLEDAYKEAEGDIERLAGIIGDDMLARAIDRDLKLLHGYGWVMETVGEMKLKGLENTELISMIYPKSLAARMKIDVPDNSGASRSSVTTTATATANGNAASNALTTRENPVYATVISLRNITLRLEKLCSYLNGGSLVDESWAKFEVLAQEVSELGTREDALAAYLEHSITRLEVSYICLYDHVMVMRRMKKEKEKDG
ncbi:phosphatase 2C-domain-containing protein [Myxozyma melibiosi]|uniref:Adenylate cyclase n=1 Tax=Myxozyma melibiosi TaxID=54550 RepID=A0ABR1F9H9_9ASCO